MCVSQFTLLASTSKGKLNFSRSASAEVARELYEKLIVRLEELHGKERVKNGAFQKMMDVQLVNDGPVSESEGGNKIGAAGMIRVLM